MSQPFRGDSVFYPNYGCVFSEMQRAMEEDLALFDDEEDAAMEVLTLSRSAAQSSKTDNANNNLNQNQANDTQDNNQNYIDQAERNGEKAMQVIERIHRMTNKLLTNTLDENEKFIDQYTNSGYKLQDELTVINWSYGHNAENYLHGKVAKLRAILTNNANYLGSWQNIPDDALIKMKGKALDKELIGELGAPSSIDTMKEFQVHLQQQFRGRKSEKNYRGEMAEGFLNDIRNFAKVKTTYSQDISAAERICKSVVSKCTGIMRGTQYSDDDKKMVLKYQRSVFRIMSAYLNLVYFYYRLYTEFILNRRLIIQRLYQK